MMFSLSNNNIMSYYIYNVFYEFSIRFYAVFISNLFPYKGL